MSPADISGERPRRLPRRLRFLDLVQSARLSLELPAIVHCNIVLACHGRLHGVGRGEAICLNLDADKANIFECILAPEVYSRRPLSCSVIMKNVNRITQMTDHLV